MARSGATVAATEASANPSNQEVLLSGAELDNHLFPKSRPTDLASVVSLIFNGYRRAMIEHCLCVSYVLGGIDKEARLAARLEAMHMPYLQIDAGGFIQEPTRPGARLQTRYQLAALGAMKLHAVNVGFHDLGMGTALLRDAQTSFTLPFVSCNVSDSVGALLFAPTKNVVVTLQNGREIQFGIIGATRPRIMGISKKNQPQDSKSAAEYDILDAADCIRKYLPELRKHSDVVVLLVYATRVDTQRLLESLGPDSGIDIAVAGESPKDQASPTQINGTWLVGGGFEGWQVGHMMIQFADGKITKVVSQMIEVIQTIPSVPELTRIVKEYQSEKTASKNP